MTKQEFEKGLFMLGKSHHALMQTLKRKGFENPGALSRLLLKAFTEDNGLIVGGAWSDELAMDEDSPANFSLLRQHLKIAHLLNWDENVKKCHYQPGKNLINYVSRQRLEIQQFASKADLNAVKTRQDSTEAEITNLKLEVAEQRVIMREQDARFLKLEAIVSELNEVIGDPDTPERRNKRQRLASDLSKHIMTYEH